jgi:hypothetical protein
MLRARAAYAAWRRSQTQIAIKEVITKRLARDGVSSSVAQDIVLVTATVAMGAGLFGRSLAELAGRPLKRPRELISALLLGKVAVFYRGASR